MKRRGLFIALTLMATAWAATPKNTYVEAVISDPGTLDPSQSYDAASGQFIENVYETLLGYKGGDIKTLVPVLATDYKPSDGGKTWTFTIRKGVKFQNGDAMSCEDAEYSFKRALVVTNANSWGGTILGVALFGNSQNANEDKEINWERINKAVQCSGDKLTFRLVQPDASFPYRLAFNAAGIIDQKWAVANGEWSGTEKDWKAWIGKDLQESNSFLNRNMNGTGAYRYVGKNGNQYVLKAFDGYWGEKPKLENVIIQVIPDEATQILALKQGDIDAATGITRASLKQIDGALGVRIIDDIPSLVQTAIWMNEKVEDKSILGTAKIDEKGMPANFFSDLNVRKGFAYAYDYNRHIKEISLGKAKRRTMALPENFYGYDPSIPLINTNPEQAKAFFKKAWDGKLWDTGFTVVITYNSGSTNRKRVAELLKANIEALNPKFHLTIREVPFAQMIQDQNSSRLAMSVGGWGPDYPDPDDYIPVFYGSTRIGGYYGPAHNFQNDTIDKAILQARATTNLAKRESLYKLIGRIGSQEVPFILLPVGVLFQTVRDDLKGVYFNDMVAATAGYKFKDLSK